MDRFPSRERSSATALEPRVSAIVVVRGVKATAQGRGPLELCLRSAIAEPWIDDLVVVDHGNAEEISSLLRAHQADRRDFKLVQADPSLSTAAVANLGVEHARGRWLLFLDPDVVLQRGAVARMAAAGGEARQPWIVGGRLTDAEGRDRRAARAGALTAFSAIAVAMDWPGVRPPRRKPASDDAPAARVAAVSGAFMLIPRDQFQALGGFDGEYATAEAADLDLCRRAAEAGGSVLFQPAAAGVQLVQGRRRGQKRVAALARYAARSARTPIERGFAAVATPALAVLMGLKEFVAGRPPLPR